MNNCNTPKRYGAGSMIPGAIGMQDFGGGMYGPAQSGGEQDELTALMLTLAQNAGKVPQVQAPAQRQGMGRKFDWGQFAQAAGLGTMAGLGGNKGVAIAPILAMIMQLGKGKFGQAPPTARTPSFVDDGRYGG